MDHSLNNESNSNRIISRANRIVLYLGLAACFLNYIHIFNVKDEILYGMVVALIIPLMVPTILSDIFLMTQSWVKYIILTTTIVSVGIGYFYLTFQVDMLFVLPTILAVLYLDKKLLYITIGETTICIFLSHIFSAFHLLQPQIEPYTDLSSILRMGALGRILLYLASAFVLCYVQNRLVEMESSHRIKTEQETGSPVEIPAPPVNKTENDEKPAKQDKQEIEDRQEHELSTEAMAILQTKNLEPIEKYGTLTEREAEICLLLVQGMDNDTISKTLHISMGTAKNYISKIYDKTGIRQRTILVLELSRLLQKS